MKGDRVMAGQFGENLKIHLAEDDGDNYVCPFEEIRRMRRQVIELTERTMELELLNRGGGGRRKKMNEQDYIQGSNAAWRHMLGECRRHLGLATDEKELLRLQTERLDAIAALRELCEEWGDNDWDDDLHLADIIEKHFRR